MPNRMTNTGIIARNYNSRGLITHAADTRALVRQSDGTLWAVLRENTPPTPISLWQSSDNGFSWQRRWTGGFANANVRQATTGMGNTNGPHLSLQVYEHLDRIVLWHAYAAVSSNPAFVNHGDVQVFVWKISDPTVTLGESISSVVLGADSPAIDVPYNEHRGWLIHTVNTDLVVKEYHLATAGRTARMVGLFYDIFQGVAHQDNYVDIAIVEEAATSNVLRHVRYGSAFGLRHTIHDAGAVAEINDVSIARDGHNNLLVIWTQATPNDTNVDVFYSLSSSDGASWTAPARLEKQVGHSAYRDPATARLACRSTALGGRQGFMLSYVHKNASEVAKTLVRTLLTQDGITYVLGDPREVATQVALPADQVVGLRWFRPPASSLLDLSDPGQIRVAYQIGEGNSRVEDDSVPVRVGQELLNESAYPSSLASASGTYVIEGANSIQLPVNFNVLGAPNENVDYFSLGLTGHVTGRYMAAFHKVGTELRFQRFDPILAAEMDDRSAYSAPVEQTSLAVLDPQSYQFPVLGQRGQDDYSSYIERDVRQLFLPPDMHLERAFVVNAGNFLKRTVWLVTFDGVEYEISQVVPYFLDAQIAYYGANAYVVGPSNDPFSRAVLPSET